MLVRNNGPVLDADEVNTRVRPTASNKVETRLAGKFLWLARRTG